MTEPSSAQSTTGAASAAAPLDFRKLFDAEVSYVWKTLRRLGVRPSDVEDVANEVWMTVYRRLDSYDRARPIRPWLFGIAFRVAVAEKRLAYRRHEVLATEEGHAERLASSAPPADEQLSAQDAHRLVLDALQSVDIDRRAIFVMHDMDEVEMKEIAASLDVPVNTAYSRLRLAREEFKSAVIRLQKRRSP
jgi:RNA polymerase sigma-70 factor, ECF subfamily